MPTRDIAAASNRALEQTRVRTRSLGLLLALLLAGFCLLSVAMLRTMREEAWNNAVRTSQNLLRAQTTELDRTLTIYDASLRTAATTLTDPALRGASTEMVRLAIFEHVQTPPDLGPVRILGRSGMVAYDSSSLQPEPASPGERRALASHRLLASGAPVMSAPFRTEAGVWAVTLSHRISDADGGFAGIVVGTIRLHLFFDQLRDLNLGPHDVVSLFSTGGVMLAHIPDNDFLGRSIAGTPQLRRFLARDAGTFVAPAPLDGIRRVFSFRHVAQWPLFLDVGLSTDDLYQSWYRRAVVTGLVLAAMVGFAVFLLWLLRRDLHTRQMNARALTASEARYRVLAEGSSDLIVRVDRNMIRTYVSPSCRKFGYEPEELLGLPGHSLMHEEDLPLARQVLTNTLENQVEGELACRLRHKSGKYTWIEAHLSPMEGGYISVIRDIDKRKRDEELREANHQALAQLAATDGLTTLANRRIFDEQLLRAWQDSARGTKPLSLLMLDVDHFKAYNDCYGHPEGDAILVKVAQLISRNVKRADDTAARYGGEEFAVLLPAADIYGAIEVAEAIRSAVWEAAFAHGGAALGRLTVSIGVATAMPSLGTGTPEGLIKAADDELYRGKQGGRNRVYARALLAEPEPEAATVARA